MWKCLAKKESKTDDVYVTKPKRKKLNKGKACDMFPYICFIFKKYRLHTYSQMGYLAHN